MITRLRILGVDNIPCRSIWVIFTSSSSVSTIWVYSALTNSEFSSPSAWYLTRMAYASSPLPLDINQRGDSGRYKMKETWRREGTSWRNDGILHPQLLVMANVPRVTVAAATAPMSHQFELPRDRQHLWFTEVVSSVKQAANHRSLLGMWEFFK